MKLNIRSLRSHPLLSLLPATQLRELLSESALREFHKGTVIFREGEPSKAIFLLLSGRCQSSHQGERGAEVVEEVFGPGDTLGEREMLNQEPYRSTVRVISRCVVLPIQGQPLQELFEKYPGVGGRYFQRVASHLRLLRERREKRGGAGRVVAMISLSPQLHQQAVAERLASSLHGLAQESVLLVEMTAGTQHPRLQDWPRDEVRSDGEFCYATQSREHERGFHHLHLHTGGDEREARLIAPLAGHLGRHFIDVVLDVGPSVHPTITLECLVQADFAVVWLEPSVRCLYDFKLLLDQIAAHDLQGQVKILPLVSAGDFGGVEEFSTALDELQHPACAFVRGAPLGGASAFIDRARTFGQQINSLARLVTGRRIGLALSSGGAKGLAHIGVIQVLEENGIEVDAVAGSSMGAFVGSVWAAGHDGGGLERCAVELDSRWSLVRLAHPVFPPRRGFLRTGRAIKQLHRFIGDVTFSQLRLPLRVVATYLDSLERVVFSSGPVAAAVEASIAIPGICVPVTLDGETFIDGGIADPLPVDVLREMGLERVIAVNTIPTPDRLRQCLDVARELCEAKPPPRSVFRTVGSALNRHLNYFASGNVLDTMLRATNGVQTRIAEYASREADLVLRPWNCDSHWHDFNNPRKYIALGRKVAEQSLAELKALTTPERHEKHPARMATAA